MHARTLALVALLGVAGACGRVASGSPTTLAVTTTSARPGDVHLRVEVIGTAPHDRGAFTEGFELHDGKFLESSGLYGASWLRWVDAETGSILVEHTLADDVFAEGTTVVGDRVVQLSYQEERAFVYDAETLRPIGEFSYTGEGWGLCTLGEEPAARRLVMSDGSAVLTFRDPTTFVVTGSVEVRDASGPVANLNELECVGGEVYANVWMTERIVRIDPASGEVNGDIDASGLLSAAEANGVDVLNGIAFEPSTQSFWLTGKYWPVRLQVRFVPAVDG